MVLFGKIYWDGWGRDTGVFQRWKRLSLKMQTRLSTNLTYVILKNPQDNISGMTGPGYVGKASTLGHRIVFMVDFANTPGNTQDDQRFDGYIFTQTLKTAQQKGHFRYHLVG